MPRSSKTLAAAPTARLTVADLSAVLRRCASLFGADRFHAHLLKSGRLGRSAFLCNCLAAAYSRLGAAASAVALLHGAPAKNRFSNNILLTALLKSGRLGAAQMMFDEMPEKDTVTYNAMISGYIANSHAEEAFELVYRMQELGVRPSGFTLSITASSVCSPCHAKLVHAAVVRHGLGCSNLVVSNSLIDMYRHVGLTEYAVGVFVLLEEPDVVSWNSVMSVYKDMGRSNRVFECFQSMRTLGFSVDAFSMSTVLSACTDIADVAKGEQLLALCFKMGFLWNSIVSSAIIDLLCVYGRVDDAVWLFRGMARWDSELCNSMVSGYARSGLLEEALGLFVMAMRNGVLPNEFTFASMLRSSSCFGLMEQGTQIHCLICKLGFEDDVIIASALVDMYSKLGCTRHAREIFHRVDVKDLVLWNTMIMGLAHNGRGKEALGMFGQMLHSGIRADRITLLGALSACSTEGLVSEGMQIISSVQNNYIITPGTEHYACVVDMLSREGLFREAIDLIENRLQKCNAAAFSTVLEACLIYGNLDMAELIAGKMMKLESRSSVPYFVLAQAYGARGKWESMARMWRLMEEHRAKKVHGCSWVCIKNRIVVFTSKKIVHHGGEATYAALELLVWDMMEQGYPSEYVESIYRQEE